MNLYEDRLVVAASDTAELNPNTAITIAVDTAYVGSMHGKKIGQAIYMMDNMLANGSKGEGTLDLHTNCNVGSLIGWNSVAINGEGSSGDTVVITGFTVSQGNVFTAAGQPREVPPPKGEPAGSYWVGQAMNSGSQTYRIEIKVTIGKLHPVSYYYTWDPFITAS